MPVVTAARRHRRSGRRSRRASFRASLCSKIIAGSGLGSGLGSASTAVNMTLAASGELGCSTYNSDAWPEQTSMLWLCCAAALVPDPEGKRNTTSTAARLPSKNRSFAA